MCTDGHDHGGGGPLRIPPRAVLRGATDGPPAPVPLRPVDRVSVTVLVDNVTDMLATDRGPARRWPLAAGRRITNPVLEGAVPDPLRAEHGFSALVEVTVDGTTHRILFDTGISPDGMVANMDRLEVVPGDVGAVVMSHGHFDHTGGLAGLARRLGRSGLPVLVHPDFWLRRRIAVPGREPFELPTPSRRALEDAGFEIVESPGPGFLLDGAVLVTGEVERTTAFETGFPVHEADRGSGWEPDPLIRDDQALVVLVRGRGLLVITGCGHAGVVNTVVWARRLTGVTEVAAVIGGFHLSGPLFAPAVGPTVEALATLGVGTVMPGHCTGWEAQRALADRLGDAYVHPAVGTTVELAAA